ncbi:MAG: hypothetical protein GY858_06965 [Candidatus Omnitrophica bacterium]|nr:hypothetical protein [Candidatus Omnitrophota bacterium]
MNKLFKTKILLFFFLLLPVLTFAFRIDTPKIEVKLSSGDNHAGTIIVENPSKDELFFKVYLEDFVYTSPFEGDKQFSPPGSNKFSMVDFINFSPREFTLAPYSQARVNYTISADRSLSGVRCGVLFFETSIGHGQDKSGRGLNILGRIGSLVFLEPDNVVKKASFADINSVGRSLQGAFSNLGDSFLRVKGSFYVVDQGGMVKDRGEISEFYLLPGDRKDLQISLPDKLLGDTYSLIATFDIEDGDVLVKEVDFSISSHGTVAVIDTRD